MSCSCGASRLNAARSSAGKDFCSEPKGADNLESASARLFTSDGRCPAANFHLCLTLRQAISRVSLLSVPRPLPESNPLSEARLSPKTARPVPLHSRPQTHIAKSRAAYSQAVCPAGWPISVPSVFASSGVQRMIAYSAGWPSKKSTAPPPHGLASTCSVGPSVVMGVSSCMIKVSRGNKGSS